VPGLDVRQRRQIQFGQSTKPDAEPVKVADSDAVGRVDLRDDHMLILREVWMLGVLRWLYPAAFQFIESPVERIQPPLVILGFFNPIFKRIWELQVALRA
jgi:hypothetical protein